MQDEPHLICYGLADEYPDPEYFLHKGILPYMRSKDFPGYLDRVRVGRRILDSEERIAWYQALDKFLVEEAVIIPLVYPRLHMLIKPWVKGFPLSQSARGEWKDVIIEPHD
jgi:ABC-type transport system substrate-binding protein